MVMAEALRASQTRRAIIAALRDAYARGLTSRDLVIADAVAASGADPGQVEAVHSELFEVKGAF